MKFGKAEREVDVKDTGKVVVAYDARSEWARRVAEGVLRELGLK
ncbi:hypothetical protein [Thermofilum pendens]|uniref:Uncharacterized protein n=1 Tax=Thermofilum pendens (strain DSM 2475 / Hrk 5) TaxID=368408 RepID=A1RW87_THEPD|nr:hypothetical protein [Thermofilum pendens]ABL77467.1 hypothetical protein Tpen_0057 [Thermofilum pendens Hrk 5]